MHLHREPDACEAWPDWAKHIARHLNLLEALMTAFGSAQAHLDADVESLAAAFAALQAEIDAVKTQPGADALDFTNLDALAAKMQAAVPPMPPAAPAGATNVQLGGAVIPVATSSVAQPPAAPAGSDSSVTSVPAGPAPDAPSMAAPVADAPADSAPVPDVAPADPAPATDAPAPLMDPAVAQAPTVDGGDPAPTA